MAPPVWPPSLYGRRNKNITQSHSTSHACISFYCGQSRLHEPDNPTNEQDISKNAAPRQTPPTLDSKMVCTDCGCKAYFEDERSDTESLTPHRPPVMIQPDYYPQMLIPTTIAQPGPAYLPNPDPVTGINPGAVVQVLNPILPPPQPAGPALPFGTGPPNPIPFPQPVYQPLQPQPVMMPPAPIQQIAPPAAPVPQIAPPMGFTQVAPPMHSLAPPVPQPGPIRQLPGFGPPAIPQGPAAAPGQFGPGIIGPPGGPAPMLPMPVPPQPLRQG